MKEYRKYQITYFFRFVGDAFFYPFFALYLKYLNVPNKDLGIILMILPLTALFVNPLWSMLSRNVNDNRLFLRILPVIEAISVIILVSLNQLSWIPLVVIMIAIVGQPIYVLLDSFTSIYTKKTNTSYGNIRLWGSLAYGLATLSSGLLISKIGYEDTFMIAAFFLAIVAILMSWILPIDLTGDENLNTKSDIKVLGQNKNYIKFALFYVITLGIMFGGDNYLSLYFQTFGLDADGFGFVTFVFVIGEILVLALLSKFGDKLSTRSILVAIALANGLRFLYYGFDLPLWSYIAFSFIRSISMGSMLYITVRYITEITEPKNVTLGILIFSSVRSLFTALIMMAGGFLTEYYGYRLFYVLSGVIALSALFFIDYKNTKKELV
ncbi:PPP family 3-phenylpropionic acid transporter [Acholeplasma morum]|uniref:MFS transporter n=1 Tax=Paracholeplasma morum TaxID=264637 RepID=UPI00195755D0|nr:MFS transporter [Paracholeplasma morum]MBM7453542.1 PPP family 3-phenylpropionic acid transporter [Paracholeplasma morum]